MSRLVHGPGAFRVFRQLDLGAVGFAVDGSFRFETHCSLSSSADDFVSCMPPRGIDERLVGSCSHVQWLAICCQSASIGVLVVWGASWHVGLCASHC